MFNKKSQAAMEFLMTYGWAIMIVLIGIGALFFLGVFNPSTPSVCNATSPFICQDVLIQNIGFSSVILRIASTNIDSATIGNIKINGVSCADTSIKVGYKSDYSDLATTRDITNSKNTPAYVNCLISGGTLNLPIGSKVAGSFEIVWVKQFGTSHTTSGTFSGTTEE